MSSGALKVAVFRAPEDAEATQAELAGRGFAAAIAPVTQIVGVTAPLPEGPFAFAVATSAKAFAFEAAFPSLPLFVVGEKTAQAARARGLVTAPPADDVAALLPLLPQGRALYLAGRDRKPDLEAALAGRVAVGQVYAAEARPDWTPEEAADVAGAAAALHFSARGAQLAAALAQRAGIGPAFLRLIHVCLSREAAAPLASAGAARAMWPHRPTQDELLNVLESALSEFRSEGGR